MSPVNANGAAAPRAIFRGTRGDAVGETIPVSQHGHSVTRKTMKTAHGAVHGGRHFRIRSPSPRTAVCRPCSLASACSSPVVASTRYEVIVSADSPAQYRYAPDGSMLNDRGLAGTGKCPNGLSVPSVAIVESDDAVVATIGCIRPAAVRMHLHMGRGAHPVHSPEAGSRHSGRSRACRVQCRSGGQSPCCPVR